MGKLQFNLHEGIASVMLAKACAVAPTLHPIVEDYREMGLTDVEIMDIISKQLRQLATEIKQRTLQ